MRLQIKHHKLGIPGTNRKKPSLLGINGHPGRSFARSERPLPCYRSLAKIDRGYRVDVLKILIEQSSLRVQRGKFGLSRKLDGSDNRSLHRFNQGLQLSVSIG